jgi:3-deoxy-D-manno-octulosonate 8-phosphate phosphatase (KDO 8-P phosphatase)
VSGPNDIGTMFEREGAVFVTPADELAVKLARIRALVFDWDGVFNRGEKGSGSSSGFSEADSMGVNMLRFGLWLRDRELPVAAIVTGEVNPSSELFVARERFHCLFQGVRDKRDAMRVRRHQRLVDGGVLWRSDTRASTRQRLASRTARRGSRMRLRDC